MVLECVGLLFVGNRGTLLGLAFVVAKHLVKSQLVLSSFASSLYPKVYVIGTVACQKLS